MSKAQELADGERELFESYMRKDKPAFPLRKAPPRFDGTIDYLSAGTQHQWQGWQARAALSSSGGNES